MLGWLRANGTDNRDSALPRVFSQLCRNPAVLRLGCKVTMTQVPLLARSTVQHAGSQSYCPGDLALSAKPGILTDALQYFVCVKGSIPEHPKESHPALAPSPFQLLCYAGGGSVAEACLTCIRPRVPPPSTQTQTQTHPHPHTPCQDVFMTIIISGPTDH